MTDFARGGISLIPRRLATRGSPTRLAPEPGVDSLTLHPRDRSTLRSVWGNLRGERIRSESRQKDGRAQPDALQGDLLSLRIGGPPRARGRSAGHKIGDGCEQVTYIVPAAALVAWPGGGPVPVADGAA